MDNEAVLMPFFFFSRVEALMILPFADVSRGVSSGRLPFNKMAPLERRNPCCFFSKKGEGRRGAAAYCDFRAVAMAGAVSRRMDFQLFHQ
jgi:hypothetical protein